MSSAQIVQAPQQQAMTFAETMEYANTVCRGSLVPRAYQGQPANVLIAIDFGRSMGLSPAESLYRITVINGKPTASAELIAANVRRAGHRLRIRKDAVALAVTVEIVRADDPDYTFSSTWTMDRAKQACLTGKDNWKHYPLAMLTARAITECARDACPEALYGVVYTGEEMGAARTDEQGAPEPQPVAATVEPAVDLQPVRDLFRPFMAATGTGKEEAVAAICAAVGVKGGAMRDMDAAQARRAASWMEEEIAAASEPEATAPSEVAAEAVPADLEGDF